MNDGMTFVSAPRVLLIEDEHEIGETLCGALQRSGMNIAWAKTGAQALVLMAEFEPEIVLVDLNLPDADGIALVGWLAEQGKCGVIVVSGLGDEAARVIGLELGADDYIAKPPHLRELIARVRAVHRRVKLRAKSAAVDTSSPAVQVGPISIDLRHRSVHALSGERISLTGAEFAALETLLAAGGVPVTRDVLSKAALHRPWRPEDRSVDQLIFNLRQKMPGDGDRLIQSVRGAGYLLASSGRRVPKEKEKQGIAMKVVQTILRTTPVPSHSY